MHFQHLKIAFKTFLLLLNLSLAVKVPTKKFDLLEFLKEHEPKNNAPGITSFSEYHAKILPPSVSTPEECNRICYVRTAPKTCYYRFVIEHYTTNSGACELCFRNGTNSCQCILADGFERTIIAVNRQLPGPSIQVCKNDHVIVDVYNAVDGGEITIHWHGIHQHGSQYYDGVPFVTQCPIHKGTVFRYQWKAENPGSHFWHSHTGFQKIDGVTGSIIVREEVDIHQHLYDYDNSIMVINDWYHELGNERFPGRLKTLQGQDPDNILINGKGQFVDPITNVSTNTPLEVFEVEKGKRFRFRIIEAGATTCPVHLIIQNHKMQIIATDGEPVLPVIVDSVILVSAERYDFVLDASNNMDAYWIQVKAIGLCKRKRIHQLGILKYKNGPDVPKSEPPSFDSLPTGKVMNLLDDDCTEPNDNGICVEQLYSAYRLPPNLLKEVPDIKIFLPFKFAKLPKEEVFKANTYNKFLVIGDGVYLSGLIDGISNMQPSSPLLSQYPDVNPKQFCDGDKKPDNCVSHCLCTHIIKIPLNAVVQVIMVDEVQENYMYHPFHLHGHTFYVMGMGHLPNTNESINLEKAISLDMKRGLLTKFRRPPGKDTLHVPNNGYAAFRFIADNPGFWFFHCHFLYHLTIGMNLIFQVGNVSDLPPVPKDFPKCGNFLPDIF